MELRIYDFSTKESTIEAIRKECVAQGLTLAAQEAYVLATVEWETARTFKPVREGLNASDAWRRKHLSRYYPYYGRGFVQITWYRNYKKYGELLDLDLLANPDLALDPNVAVFILVHGFKNGVFTGKKLEDYITTRKVDFHNARKCINGLDRASEIEKLAEKHLKEINK